MNILFWWLIILATTVVGQQTVCGTDDYNQQFTYVQSIHQVDPDSVDLTTQYTIPLVFHIVHNDSIDPDQNLTDSDIQFLLNSLNRDFNLQNTDTSNLTDTLKLLPGNMRINFELEAITRTATTIGGFTYYNNAVKLDSLGGIDAWDPKNYFNIWICNLSGGLLGYSQFPGGPLRFDGIVVDYDVVTDHPKVWTNYNKGRICAHEIGHSLSLRHPWGNGFGCQDNLVDDIPTQNGAHWDCPDTTYSVCNGNITRDVVKHYMEYCGDSCAVMFTKGQVYNARKSIQEYRMDLVTPDYPSNIVKRTLETHDIKIYPTITNSCLKIYNTHNIDDLHVIIYGTNGQQIMSYDVSLINELNLNVSEFAEGIYIVNFIHKGIKLMTKKLIVSGSHHRLTEKYILID